MGLGISLGLAVFLIVVDQVESKTNHTEGYQTRTRTTQRGGTAYPMGKRRVPLSYLAPARLRGQHSIQLATRERVQSLGVKGGGTAHGQISSTDALRRLLPTTMATYSHVVAGSARRPCATGVQ